MGRKPCCDKLDGLKRGPWTVEEDQKLTSFILNNNGIHSWRLIPKLAGLMRCGKSSRLRWMNYLRPGLKREPISKEEEALIIELHSSLGNRWSEIAANIPGRTDNGIKNHWNKIKKKLGGLDDDLHGVELRDKDQTHKQPADEKHQDQEEIDDDDDHVEYKSSEAKQVVEVSSNTSPSRAGSMVDDDISKNNRENINGSDHRPLSSSSSSSCGSSSTNENITSGVLIDSSPTLLIPTSTINVPQVDHQDHAFSLEMDESFCDKDFNYWLESPVEPILIWDGIDP